MKVHCTACNAEAQVTTDKAEDTFRCPQCKYLNILSIEPDEEVLREEVALKALLAEPVELPPAPTSWTVYAKNGKPHLYKGEEPFVGQRLKIVHPTLRDVTIKVAAYEPA